MEKSLQVKKVIENYLEESYKYIAQNIDVERNINQILIFTHFLTILEYGKAICNLLEEKNFTPIDGIFRSVLESKIELKNLCLYDDYYLYLEKQMLEKRIKYFENCHKFKQNEFLTNPEIIKSNLIKEDKEKISTIEKRGFSFTEENKLEIKDKFELADALDLYYSIYDINCIYVHGNILALESRHIIFDEENQINLVRSKLKIDDFKPYLLTFVGIIFISMESILKKFGKKRELELFEKSFNENRDRLKQILN